MGIFRREQGDVQQASTAPSPEMGAQGGQLEQQATLMPPFAAAPGRAAAPGVVPPPAAPMYSMRAPEGAPRYDEEAESLVAEKVRLAREAQRLAQARVRGAVERARTASPATGARRRQAQQAPAPSRPARHEHRIAFDPVRAAQTGLLNLAWSWQEAGAPIRAIHTYMQVLVRYPDTAAADAAVADLVELSDKLAGQGQFHIALGIYDHLEELLACEQ